MRRSVAAVAVTALLVAACGSSTVSPSPTRSASVGPSGAASPGAGPSQAPRPSPTQAPVTAPPPTPVGSSVDAMPCGPDDLLVDVSGHGATGSILLDIDVTNTGSTPCVLAGAPSSIGLRAGGGSLPTTYQARQDPWPGDTADVVAPPVVLRPHSKAQARAIWRNWCGGLPADVSTVWVYFGTEARDASPDPFISPPRCDNQSAESTLQGFPYQEDTSGG